MYSRGAEDEMRSRGIVALAISGTVVTTYHVLHRHLPPPELGVTPEVFDWGPGWVGWIFGFVLSTVILAVVIGLAIQFARWLVGLRDWS
jgi:hypothetical protein